MIIVTALFCLAGLTALGFTSWKARDVRRDEGRMAGYIASLKAVAADHRARIAELELALSAKDQTIAAQDRLLEGQAAHLRLVDPRYVG